MPRAAPVTAATWPTRILGCLAMVRACLLAKVNDASPTLAERHPAAPDHPPRGQGLDYGGSRETARARRRGRDRPPAVGVRRPDRRGRLDRSRHAPRSPAAAADRALRRLTFRAA